MEAFEIREITESEDLLRYQKLCTKLFRAPNGGLRDEQTAAENALNERKNAPRDNLLLGAFYNGTLYAGMRLLPYDIRFDGAPALMCGIGGVISDRECPERGAVKALFRDAFVRMREQGRSISHLYPFEMRYYRQYGYDVSCSMARWRIPVSYFQTTGDGFVRAFDNSDEMKRQITAIYDAFSKNYNFALRKSSDDWEQFFSEHDAYSSGWFSYVHETDGKADAFLSYRCEPNPDRPQDLHAATVWFSSLSGLRELFSYFKTQIPYADRAVIDLPEGIDLSAVIECSGGWGMRNADVSVSFTGTSRAVDAEAILSRAKCREGADGTVKLRISGDDYCPWNNGLYTVRLRSGASPEVMKTDDAVTVPDIALNANSFASMIFGRYGVDTCTLLPGVKLYGNAQALSGLFYKKQCFIDRHF